MSHDLKIKRFLFTQIKNNPNKIILNFSQSENMENRHEKHCNFCGKIECFSLNKLNKFKILLKIVFSIFQLKKLFILKIFPDFFIYFSRHYLNILKETNLLTKIHLFSFSSWLSFFLFITSRWKYNKLIVCGCCFLTDIAPSCVNYELTCDTIVIFKSFFCLFSFCC